MAIAPWANNCAVENLLSSKPENIFNSIPHYHLPESRESTPLPDDLRNDSSTTEGLFIGIRSGIEEFMTDGFRMQHENKLDDREWTREHIDAEHDGDIPLLEWRRKNPKPKLSYLYDLTVSHQRQRAALPSLIDDAPVTEAASTSRDSYPR
ncbi:hypothetical protein F5Y12DRAFT_712232 [Xylaria sp. FL1777]|nr:hypothetical protein F5Y12DRAFT_712232 [Xylaria sp. FL1777]